jgi:hypothetical protein
VARDFAGERQIVVLLQYPSCAARLWVVNRNREPFTTEELLTVGDALIAVAEVDCNVMNSIRVDYREVLVPRQRVDA